MGQTHFYERTFYDLMFFIIIIVLLLNIIFGIIIDTFSQLREENEENNRMMKTQCIVCSIDREKFEFLASMHGKKSSGRSIGFEEHIQYEHNMWSYFFFILYLRNKDRTEMTGAESYVRKLIDKQDVSWMPYKDALVMSAAS